MTDRVPTVDLRDPTATALGDLDTACRDHGFFLVRGHDLDDLVTRTWEQTRRFFAAGEAVKEPIRRTAESPLGWFDRELTKRRRDHKEVFDFIDPEAGIDPDPNRWPADLPGFRETMEDFFLGFADLADRVLTLVHGVLELDRSSAADHPLHRSASTVRLNHYPTHDPVAVAADRADLRPPPIRNWKGSRT